MLGLPLLDWHIYVVQDLMADVLKSKAPPQSPLTAVVQSILHTMAELPANEPQPIKQVLIASKRHDAAVRATPVVRFSLKLSDAQS